MNQLKRALIWLGRIGHCRGFGIQSPTDYAFVRNVVNEHSPYYAYDELGRNDNWLDRKLGKLYLRLANHRQPRTISAYGHTDWLMAGCKKARMLSANQPADLMIAARPTDALPLLPQCTEDAMLVVERIADDCHTWQQIVDSEQAVVSFDLYYCGIVFFDKKRYKHHYIVNF
jgi:hypothetical protein